MAAIADRQTVHSAIISSGDTTSPFVLFPEHSLIQCSAQITNLLKLRLNKEH
jgi:hypothetical protein